jgi:DNA-binding transcriptional ArsR family regulator
VLLHNLDLETVEPGASSPPYTSPAEEETEDQEPLRGGNGHGIASDGALLRKKLEQARRLRIQRGSPLFDFADPAAFVRLVQRPQVLKKRLIHLLRRFWEIFYEQDFQTQREALNHSVAYHRQQTYPQNFGDLFRQVTGRGLPAVTRSYVQEHLRGIERVIFTPCAHLGLYFQITLSPPTLVVAFNYRTTPAQEKEDTVAIELFPPLKALADETRLHILALLQEKEMCAQEIIEAVDLSQSTVSRHLQLLERTELVTTRPVRRVKYYSINRSRGREITAALQHLIG